MTATVTATAALTEAQLRAVVADWLRRGFPEPVLALRARPQWTGSEHLEVAGVTVRVVSAVSALAIRAALVDRSGDERIVALTECDETDLGTGVLTHCRGHRVISVDPWQIVRGLFDAAALDPALVAQGRRLAEALLEYAPPGGWPPVSGGVLTRNTAMRGLAARLLGVEATDLDATGLLQWSTRSADVVRYAALPRDLRQCVTSWLTDVAKAVARWCMACVDSGHGTDAIPLGVVAGLLWDDPAPSAVVVAARVRLEQYLGGHQPSDDDARRWRDAALAWIERTLDSTERTRYSTERAEAHRLLGRAEELARHLQAEPLIVRSDLLPSAYDARLREFADTVRAALARPGRSTLNDAEEALRRAGRHALSPVGDRYATAEAAMRALRWLSTPDTASVTLAEALARQVNDDGWVDRTRLRLWVGAGDPAVADAYRRLHIAVDARRVRHDEEFARLLAAATTADVLPGTMLRVEDLLHRVVRPILDGGRGVLLLVVDGMSVAASTDLVESVTEGAWWELTPAGGPRVGILAALPTVTEVSRTSLFCGRLAQGGQPEERSGLAALFGPDAVIFHKADLVAGSGSGENLGRPVVDALADPGRRLVAAVVNTIDDALDRSDPAAAEWTLQSLRIVRYLVEAARDRVVVLLSDHGHVVDRGPDSELRPYPEAVSARWRPADTPPGDGELPFAGPRVVLGGGRVVLPWRETIHYTSRKAGYHGGASPAEAVIPLTILTQGDEGAVPGWSAAPVASPAWWRGPLTIAPRAAPAVAPAAAGFPLADPAESGLLFDLTPTPAAATPSTSPSGPPAAATTARPALVAALLASPLYRKSRAVRLAGRPVIDDERVAALLTALVEAGGRLRMDTLAARAGVPAQRIAATVTILRRLLAIEGYQAVEVDADGQTVVLDERTLRDQFGLAESGDAVP